MVGITYVYINMILRFMGTFFLHLYCLDVQHDCLDTCCLESLICMCFVFLYLYLFSAIEHVSHGKAL